MTDLTSGFPAPTPEDGEDVALALEAASALWRRGETQDAIRWLRRAAETAEATGDDRRALVLARTAAELSSNPQHLAPRVEPAPPPPITAPPAPPLEAAPPPPMAPAPPPPVESAPPVGAAEPAPPEPAGLEPGATPEPASARSVDPAPQPPALLPDADVEDATDLLEDPDEMDTPAAPSARVVPPASPSPETAIAEALSELLRADGTPPRSGRATSPTSLGAFRVSLRRSPDDPRLLVARLLGPDELAPKGEKNAMLVATELILEQLLPGA